MTKEIKIGNRKIGGANPILIQSMTNVKTENVQDVLLQIKALEAAGCDIIRLAVKDERDAEALKNICGKTISPLVADIHFDYKLAIKSIESGIDKIRFNPGNIGDNTRVKALVDCAKAHHVPIRIGVNAGSLDADIERKFGLTATALVESAMSHVRLLESLNFYDIVLSVKSSDVTMCVDAYRELSKITDYPLHLGVTEAGTYEHSLVKSSIAIGSLLLGGVGDTVRVSITGDPIKEVYVAKKILRALGIQKDYAEIISCPTCGRCQIDLESIVNEVERRTSGITKPIKIAIMGCVVNGIGESKNADIGLAGGDDCGVIFENGKVLEKVSSDVMIDRLMTLIYKKLEEKQNEKYT